MPMSSTRTTTTTPRRWRRVLTALAAVGALAAGTLLTAPATSASPERIAEVEAYLADLEMKAAAAHGMTEDAQYQLDQITEQINRTKAKVERAKGDLASTQRTVGQYAATAYRSGGIDASLQLLLADDPQEFLDQAVILQIVAQGQSSALRRTQIARLNLAQTTAELTQQESQAQAALTQVQQREAEFVAAVAETEAFLAQLQEEERQRLEEERKRKEAEARAAAQAAAEALAAQQEAAAAAEAAEDSGSSSGGSSSGSSGSSGSGSGGSSSGNSGSSGSGSGGSTSENGGPNDNGEYDSDSGNSGGGNSGGGNSGGGDGYSGGSGVSSDRAAIVVAYALAQVGKPYSFSAQPPNSWDCTKLTAAAWAQVGVRLTPYSYVQAQEVRRIDPSELQPGDLLFFFKNGAHHASMYIGGGQIVEASSPSTGVRIADVWNSWNVAHFSWAGRPYG